MILQLRYEQVRDKQASCILNDTYNIFQITNRRKSRCHCYHLRVTGIRAFITCITWEQVVSLWILHHMDCMLMLLLIKG